MDARGWITIVYSVLTLGLLVLLVAMNWKWIRAFSKRWDKEACKQARVDITKARIQRFTTLTSALPLTALAIGAYYLHIYLWTWEAFAAIGAVGFSTFWVRRLLGTAVMRKSYRYYSPTRLSYWHIIGRNIRETWQPGGPLFDKGDRLYGLNGLAWFLIRLLPWVGLMVSWLIWPVAVIGMVWYHGYFVRSSEYDGPWWKHSHGSAPPDDTIEDLTNANV